MPRVGAASSVADVGGLAAEMSQLRLRLRGPRQSSELLLFNLLSTSGLALPVHRTLRKLVEEVVVCRVVKEKVKVARLTELLTNNEVSAKLALKLGGTERGRAEVQELADHRGVRLMRFQEGRKVVNVEMKILLQEEFYL